MEKSDPSRLDLWQPGAYLCDVPPDLAKVWLDELNWHNRLLKPNKLNGMIRDMRQESWRYNGDAIRFGLKDDKPFLLDGQNRLAAQVESQTMQTWLVVTGLGEEVQETVDRGAARSAGDTARLRGIPNANPVMAVVVRVWLYERPEVAGLAHGRLAPSITEQMDRYEKDPERFQRAVQVGYEAKRLPVVKTIPSTAYFIAAGIDQDDADTFFVGQLIRTLGLNPGDPAEALRRRLENLAGQTGHKVDPDDAFRFMWLAWRYYREGRKVTRLNRPNNGWPRDLKF